MDASQHFHEGAFNEYNATVGNRTFEHAAPAAVPAAPPIIPARSAAARSTTARAARVVVWRRRTGRALGGRRLGGRWRRRDRRRRGRGRWCVDLAPGPARLWERECGREPARKRARGNGERRDACASRVRRAKVQMSRADCTCCAGMTAKMPASDAPSPSVATSGGWKPRGMRRHSLYTSKW